MALRRKLSDKLTAQFWALVNKNGPTQPHMNTPCWIWRGRISVLGYGYFYTEGRGAGSYHRKLRLAHRLAYEMTVAMIPIGKKACHKCDNPACMRPDHIFLGTQAENVLDAVRKGRHKNPILHGHKNPMAKLTLAQVRRLRANPPTTRADRMASAKRLGISERALRKILSGTRWALDLKVRAGAPIMTRPKRVVGKPKTAEE